MPLIKWEIWKIIKYKEHETVIVLENWEFKEVIMPKQVY